MKLRSVICTLFLPASLAFIFIISGSNCISTAGVNISRKGEVQVSKVFNQLTPEEEKVIIHKGTERPFTGKYFNNQEEGIYTCKRCGAELYRSSDKFNSHCGWPSFDDEIQGAVEQVPDADGIRTEIVCANCKGHLGHVFFGEGFTPKNTRHCVNSISLNFIPANSMPQPEVESKEKSESKMKEKSLERAIFAAGCFWGVEYHLKRHKGVVSTTVGYTGGHTANPSYEDVCSHMTGHAEAVEVIFDTDIVSFEELAKLFFEIHDFTQVNRQGPDIGEQYRTEIFFTTDEQKLISERLIKILQAKGYNVATKVTRAGEFFPAEDYHQDYFDKINRVPSCHTRIKVAWD